MDALGEGVSVGISIPNVRTIAKWIGTALLVASLHSGLAAQDISTIQVAGPPIDDFKPVYYGIRSGLFRKYGLNVIALQTNSGAAALASLAGNSSQVAFTSVPAVLQAHERGLAFKIVAPAQWYLSDHPTMVLVVKANSTIKTGRDLNDKVVAVQSLKDLNWAGTLNWIDVTGGDVSSVHVIELPNSAVLPALQEGRIDAATLTSPFLEAGISSGTVRVLAKNYDSIAKQFETSVYVSTADYIAANPDAMKRFVRAMHEAIVYTNTHLQETVDLVSSYTGIDPSVVAHSVRAVDPEYVEAKNIQPVIDVAFKFKLIDRAFSADELIDPIAIRPRR